MRLTPVLTPLLVCAAFSSDLTPVKLLGQTRAGSAPSRLLFADANVGREPKTEGSSTNPAAALEATARLVRATESFLSALDETQRNKALFAFTNATQRTRWSNLPTGIYQRNGVRLGDLKPDQRKSAMAVLAAALSPRGYQKVVEIMTAEQVLQDAGGNPPGLVFGDAEFYFSFLGKPSVTEPWILQFGGHHLALNLAVAGTNGVLTPSLTATQPASYVLNGATIRPLGEENDAGFELIHALDTGQRSKAIIGSQFRDLVLGPGKDGVALVPEGIRGSELTAGQKDLLLDLVGKWVRIQTDTQAAAKMEEIRKNLPETYFAWSGSIAAGSAAYFRVQGPTLVIEYAPQNLGGSPVNHIHTIYRDPTNEYGKKFNGL